MNKIKLSKQGWIDVVIYGLLFILCFLLFCHTDIRHTSSFSMGILDGHLFDLYEYNYKIWDMSSNYPISTYLLFAVWGIPIKLLGLSVRPFFEMSVCVELWFKLLPALTFICSGIIIYKIANCAGMPSDKSKLCMYAFLASPIAFFSPVIFGQYDVFTVFFVLLGYYEYIKGSRKKFILYFMIAITFKIYALLFFIPLLLLIEKDIVKIIRDSAAVMILYLAETMLGYSQGTYADKVVGFGALDYAFGAKIDTGFYSVSIVPVLFLLLYAYTYFKDIEKNKIFQWSTFLCCLVGACLFGLSTWHPQWLIIMVPFLVLSAFSHQNPVPFLLIDIIMFGAFIGFTVIAWFSGVDENMLMGGVLSYVIDFSGFEYAKSMKDFIPFDMNLLISVFAGLLWVSAVFKHPKYQASQIDKKIDSGRTVIRLRFWISMSLFLALSFFCLFDYIHRSSLPVYDHEVSSFNIQVNRDTIIAQPFDIEEETEITEVQFLAATYARKNTGYLYCTLVDDKGKDLKRVSLRLEDITDQSMVKVVLGNILLEPGKYYMVFTSPQATSENGIALSLSEIDNDRSQLFTIINDEVSKYQVRMAVLSNESVFY